MIDKFSMNAQVLNIFYIFQMRFSENDRFQYLPSWNQIFEIELVVKCVD